MTPCRTVLFTVVDHFFGGPPGSDPTAARAPAERPSVWLHRLAACLGADAPALAPAH